MTHSGGETSFSNDGNVNDLTDSEKALYDRQIRLWGFGAQNRFFAGFYPLFNFHCYHCYENFEKLLFVYLKNKISKIYSLEFDKNNIR